MDIKTSSAIIRITNLRLQAIIGCNEWERNQKQEVILNISMYYDPTQAIKTDDLGETIDYRSMKKRIITEVERSSFFLLERLTSHVLDIIMVNSRVISATVRIDKPKALRFADSVSIEMSAEQSL